MIFACNILLNSTTHLAVFCRFHNAISFSIETNVSPSSWLSIYRAFSSFIKFSHIVVLVLPFYFFFLFCFARSSYPSLVIEHFWVVFEQYLSLPVEYRSSVSWITNNSYPTGTIKRIPYAEGHYCTIANFPFLTPTPRYKTMGHRPIWPNWP